MMSIYSRFALVKNFSSDIELGLHDLFYVAQEVETDINYNKALRQAKVLLANLNSDQKIKVLTDPRIVSTVEAMHSHLLEFGLQGCERVEWRKYINILLRISISSLILCRQSGEVPVFNEFESSYAVPGTSIYLCFNHELKSQRGRLRIEDGLIDNANVVVQDLLVDLGSGITLASPEFALMPPFKQEHLLSIDEINSQNWRQQIEHVLKLLELCSMSYGLVSNYGRIIVPMRDERPGIQSSVSFDCLPGAVFTSPCDQIEFLAETFVHEADHQRHYLLTRNIKVWNTLETQQSPIYRSPWRDDPRPLDGILRGGSAFVSVSAFWTEVDTHPEKNIGNSQWISSRAVFTNYQALDALNVVNHSNDLTIEGRYLVIELIKCAVTIKQTLRAKNNFYELVDQAVKKQRLHNEKWLDAHSKLKSNYSELSASSYIDFQL